MSDELKDMFRLPKTIRTPLIEGTKKAKIMLKNKELLIQMGIITETEANDLRTIIDIATRIENASSNAPEIPEVLPNEVKG